MDDVIKAIEDINENSRRSTVKITLDKTSLSRIRGRLQPYENVPRLFRPALEEVADYVRGVVIPETFEKEGPGWRQLARRTVSERIRAGFPGKHPILQRTGDLYEELTEKYHHKHVEVLRVGRNARIEIGGSSKKFIENQMGRRDTNLPARPMIPGTGNIPLRREHRDAIADIINSSIARTITRGG